MARKRVGRPWLGSLKKLLGIKKERLPHGPIRRLGAERLEDRSVLSVAPLADVESISLADYLAQEHNQIGPIVPAEIATANADLPADSPYGPSPNQLLLALRAEGEDDPPPEDPPPS